MGMCVNVYMCTCVFVRRAGMCVLRPVVGRRASTERVCTSKTHTHAHTHTLRNWRCQGPRSLLEAPFMARDHQAHLRQRCLRPSALGDACLHDAILSSLPRLHNRPITKCGCKKRALDLYGDHTSTCTAHSGATKAHDWMVGALGPLFARPDTWFGRSTA